VRGAGLFCKEIADVVVLLQKFGAGAIRELGAAGWFLFFGIAQLGVAHFSEAATGLWVRPAWSFLELLHRFAECIIALERFEHRDMK